MAEYPPFSLEHPRFNQELFSGRLQNLIRQLDPTKLLAGSTQLDAMKRLLDDYKAGARGAEYSDKALWLAKETLGARTHPDTGEKILTPLCFAAYAPMQPPIILGLLSANPMTQLFWQWANQSYNVAVNYANRNGSSQMTTEQIGISYGAAVLSSCGIAWGMGKAGARLDKMGGMMGTALRVAAPYTAVVTAGCLSLIIIRKPELDEGVNVTDKEGNVYGKSLVAGRDGITKCCMARALWNIPVLPMNQLMCYIYSQSKIHAKNPRLFMPFQVVSATVCVGLGLYPAQAVFSQNAEISASSLEPEFRNICRPDGTPITEFYFNKGL